MSNIKNFINSLESSSTIKVVSSISNNWNDDLPYYNIIQLEQLILDLKPNSPKAIITICYVLSLYAKWLEENNIVDDDNFYQMIQSLDKTALWKKAKPNAPKKFISNSQFKEVMHDIGIYEDFNSLYYQSLFRCLYEGIYNDDMSVIKNLRGSDIHGSRVTLKEDNGHSYDITVSLELAENLRELASTEVWERKNRYGICQIKIDGIYPDSCFKVENRKDNSEYAYRFSYYGKLRRISKEYLEYNLLPLQLYVSGIMYRIKLEFEKNDIDLNEAFSDQNRNRLVSSIISNELARCNYDIEVRNFREMVKGHLDVFNQ